MNGKEVAVFIDCDHTLIPGDPEGRPSPAVIEAIKAAQEFCHIVLTTARSLMLSEEIIAAAELRDFCVLANGGQIVDPVSLQVIREHGLVLDWMAMIKQVIVGLKVRGVIVQGKNRRVPLVASYQPEDSLYVYVPPFANAHQQADFLEAMSKISAVAVRAMDAWGGGIDYQLNHPLANKRQGVLTVADMLNISLDNCIGIGDGQNDIDFLKVCKRRVAMGNAVDGVLELADYVTFSVDEDGVAFFLWQLIDELTSRRVTNK